MRKWFVPPYKENNYETFAAHILHYTLLLLLCITIVLFPFFRLLSQFVVATMVFVGSATSYILLHFGRFWLASLIFLCVLWICITLAAFGVNGLSSGWLSSYTIVIVFASILFTQRAVILFMGLSVASTLLLAFGESSGTLPLMAIPVPVPLHFLQQVFPLGAAGILLYTTSRMIRVNFQQVRDHEQTLLERNRQLEMEIAERQRSGTSLRVSEEKYRLLFENIPVMAAVYGRDGEIILVNKLGAKLFGGLPEAFIGRNMREVFLPEEAERNLKIQAQVMGEAKAQLIELRIPLPNGHTLYYLRNIMPLPNPDGDSINQVLVLTTELTEKYLAEQRARELTLANEKNAVLTDFFSTISHDLKTPLTTLTTSIYLLQRAETPEQRDMRINRISDQIALMDQYIQDMLTIARLEHLSASHLGLVNLNSQVDEVIDRLRPRMEDKQLQYQFVLQPDLPLMQGDEEQIRRMLTNLIENAVNYTQSGGQIKVETRAANGQVIVEVTDSGIGIEPEALPRIFERFFRTPTARDALHSGTGLGLAIVRKIVDMHAARIEVRSQVGEGTTFYVEFPAYPTC